MHNATDRVPETLDGDYVSSLDEFQRTHGAAAAMSRARGFMADYLGLIRRPPPDVVRAGLAVSELYAKGAVPPQAVTDARVACWRFLEERAATTDFVDPTHCIVRAAICLLHM